MNNIEKEKKRNWNSVSRTGRTQNCCYCRKPTPNNFNVVLPNSKAIPVYFCNDVCVEKFIEDVKKW